MKVKEITKAELFELLGIDAAETKNIGTLSMHIPNDQDNHKFIFNYSFVKEVVDDA